ncbi:MAG: flagellar hook-associated protein FlgL [Desulfuromonadaceae bacterium]|nr:flagellar hook-associated protein FlgL [Desulfuromonadaceae bacterium]
MRVTANMSAENSLYNIQRGQARLNKLEESIASGQNVNRPSDDPISTRNLLEIGDKLRSLDQYTSNINKATTWLKFTSTAMDGISAIISQAKKVAGTINTGSSDPSIRQSVHDQLVDLKKQVIDMANMQYGDQYVFGGAKNLTAPFSATTGDLTNGSSTVLNATVTGLTVGMEVSGTGIPSGSFIGAITGPNSFTLVDSLGAPVSATTTTTGSALNLYNGDSTQMSIEIAQNSSQTLNVSGDRLLKGVGTNPSYGSIDILKTFDSLITAVGDSLTPSNVPAMSQAAADLQDGAKQINIATSDILSRMARLDNMSKLNDNNKNTLLSISTSMQEVDYAKLGVELNSQKIAFEASLSATAKLTQLSLLNYM